MNADELIQGMKGYYSVRLKDYDGNIPPDWVTDELVGFAQAALAGKKVLEIACGTGLWTGWLAPGADAILATDYNETNLDKARAKDYGGRQVSFRQADAYSLHGIPEGFAGGFHADWWSHIPKSRRADFLRVFHSKLQPGARVAMVDSLYFPKKKEYSDAEGNHIQVRKLPDGSKHEVIKNFPSGEELRADLEPFATQIEHRTFAGCGVRGHGRWAMSYLTKG